MTSGKALERDNTAGYNCSYLPVDDPKAFDEAMYILMCGTGVGFSVERDSINKLPEVPGLLFDTEETIIPYGTGSIVSCDSTGNYFNLWMNGLQAERSYRFCLKVVSGSGTTDEQTNFYDDDFEFRVVR